MQLQCRPDDCHWSHCGLSFKVVSLKKHLSWEISFQQSHVTAEHHTVCTSGAGLQPHGKGPSRPVQSLMKV